FTIALLLFVLLGVLAGSLSGLLGLGGGVILVPALVFLFGLSQHTAQGTTLALLVLPVGLLAAWHYYKKGHVDLRIAALICSGFVFGGFFGAKLAALLSNGMLEHIFGFGLILIAAKMLLFQGDVAEEESASTGSGKRREISFARGVSFVGLGLFVG